MTEASSGSSAAPTTGRGLKIGLWAAQGVLALMFGMAGVMKSTQPIAELAQKLVWPGTVPAELVRFIGIAELLGAVGLILPSATRVKPGLTPLAAVGLLTIMAMAGVFHLTRGEYGGIAFNVALGAAASFVAWGRYRKAPIEPRGS
ncbi:MAG: DoxX family protein [Polyangiaceae bacterium]|nr:DoxX family protein [Polyangiaceae bacterium]